MCISKDKNNQLAKGALYRKMTQNGFKLSTKQSSETNNNFENSNLKSITYLVKNKTFYNIHIKIDLFCNGNKIWS